jgi:hypothetical protein
MKRTTLYLEDHQKEIVDGLPRGISFSKLVREHFNDIMEDYDIAQKKPFVRDIR